MKRISTYILFLFSICLVCCDVDSETYQSESKTETNTDVGDSDPVSSTRRKEIIEKLKGTTWRQTSHTSLYKPSGEFNNHNTLYETVTFSSNIYSTELSDFFQEYRYRLYVGTNLIGYWTVTKNYELFTRADMLDDVGIGSYLFYIGYFENVEFIGNTMICSSFREYDDFNVYEEIKYTKISSDSDSDSNNGSTYEAPEIGFYDYTATKSSLKVQFKIYNASDTKVQSATVYYGKNSASSSVTATVSGSMITANIYGLSSGTVYRVKCRATGPGGSTTSDEVRCITSR